MYGECVPALGIEISEILIETRKTKVIGEKKARDRMRVSIRISVLKRPTLNPLHREQKDGFDLRHERIFPEYVDLSGAG